jgi:sulfonate transport system ATP-binding protein
MATHPGGLTIDGATTAPGPTVDGATGLDPVVRVRGLSRRFGGRTVLDDLDLEIGGNEFVALLGRSGSGKSTLLRALAGLDPDVAGDGRIDVPANSSVIFQDARLLPWQRVLANVVLGLTGSGAVRRGRERLAEVGLAGRERAWPNQLSGGEQQRVALARSLVSEPRLLLADEPFGALDALTRIRMHGLLRELCQRHRPAVLLVTHDVDAAIELPAPRQHRHPRFLEYRERLLAALGVTTDEGVIP